MRLATINAINTAPKWVPIWGPGSPWGPFFRFLVPKRSPLSPFQAEEKPEQRLYINVDHLITCDDKTMKMAQTCAPNEAHLCWWRSPLGPHITQNWVPIGSPFWTKLGPHGTWEQCIRWMKVYEKWHKRVALAMICRKLFKDDQISTFSAFRFPHGS